MTSDATAPRLSLRVKLGASSFLGPGKIGLLRRIDELGSISAAARDMGMSYRRAWLLIDSLNQTLPTPVLSTELGGPGGGGATLTATGRRLLDLYLAIEVRSTEAASEELEELGRLLETTEGRSSGH